ncbi:hypothetical protein [Aureimonas mangrovi]|uniref:hypothetical protein n=1 Tax=Aureimonas mangrovi TaxID=2758041 RepID=UPI00163DB4EA|nr:hypothetical protein [Aureimonas mangrovi]
MRALITALALTLSVAAPGAALADAPAAGKVDVVRDGTGPSFLGGAQRLGGTIAEREIVRRVLKDGFAQIDDIHLRRGRYVVEAVRPNGAVFRLAYDARSGREVSRERMGWARSNDRRDYGRPRPHGVEFRLDLS